MKIFCGSGGLEQWQPGHPALMRYLAATFLIASLPHWEKAFIEEGGFHRSGFNRVRAQARQRSVRQVPFHEPFMNYFANPGALRQSSPIKANQDRYLSVFGCGTGSVAGRIMPPGQAGCPSLTPASGTRPAARRWRNKCVAAVPEEDSDIHGVLLIKLREDK